MSDLPQTSARTGDEAFSWTVLAHLLRPQGRRGELLAELLTDFPERFAAHPRVFLARPNFAGPASATRAMEVAGHWLPLGRNQGRVVLHFTGIDSISAAETLAGLDVLVPESERIALEGDAEYIDDLLGCAVYDQSAAHPGTPLGVVSGVDFPTTADGRRLDDVAPLLTVETPRQEELLIPYVREFLVTLDLAAKRIDMRLPAGLTDLNRVSSALPGESEAERSRDHESAEEEP